MPKISIIIPVHNAGQFLERLFSSICSQSFHDFECIIIDDCSDDDSFVLSEKMAEKDIRFCVQVNKKNMGLPYSIERALKYARGEYILVLDHDDWIENTMLENLYNTAVMGNYNMVFCDCDYEKQRGGIEYMKIF
jgi:glycosyltransferase involved in cell wall biosynthesis